MAKLGLQIYTLRREYAADFAESFKTAKEMGFDGVELFGALETHTPEELRAALDAAGIEICGYHTPYAALEDDKIDATLDYMRRLGNENIIVPWMPQMDVAGWETVVANFARLEPIVRAAGFRLGFHLHKYDVADQANGSYGWKMVGEGTPDSFIMQCDIGNCFGGGRNGVEVYELFSSKGRTIHAKPFSAEGGWSVPIGEDDVDWDRVIRREKAEKCEWVIIELEKGDSPDMTPVSSSAKFLLGKI